MACPAESPACAGGVREQLARLVLIRDRPRAGPGRCGPTGEPVADCLPPSHGDPVEAAALGVRTLHSWRALVLRLGHQEAGPSIADGGASWSP
jgi:hypothetical protein